MENALFKDLRQSLKEAKAIVKGDAKPSRNVILQAPNVESMLEQAGLSQSEFARTSDKASNVG